MVIGAPKAGTTSFYKALSLHPDVFMTEPKEPFFFCDDSHFAKGIKSYESLYLESDSAIARGEDDMGGVADGDGSLILPLRL